MQKPPGSGWQSIPLGKHGGFRRRKGAGWEYWYPEKAAPPRQAAEETEEKKPEKEAGGDIRKSQAFKAWFGDWERGQGSQVVKKDGSPAEQWGEKPKTVYHGTTIGGFTSFDPAHDKGANLYGRGFYFTEDKEIAATYARKDSHTRYASTREFEDGGKPITHFSADQARKILADVMEPAKAKVKDPYRTAFTLYDGNTLWALAAAREPDGRVDVEKFLAEWWKPSDMRGAELVAAQAAEAIGAKEASRVQSEITEPMHASWMIDRIERATGVKPHIPDPQVFEVYLAIRKPVDMDAEPTDAQIKSLGRIWNDGDVLEMQKQIEGVTGNAKLNREEARKMAGAGEMGLAREADHRAARYEADAKEIGEEIVKLRAAGGVAYADRLLSAYGLGSAHTFEVKGRRGERRSHVKITREALLAAKQEWTAEWVDKTENKALRLHPPSKLTWGDVYYIVTNGFRERDAQQRFRAWGEGEGYDGIRHTGGWNMGSSAHTVWIAWKPTQIKATTAKEFDSSSPDIYKHMRLTLDLLKAEQLGLFGGAWKPEGKGWQIIPKGKHGGYRRHKGGTRGWEYKYPGDTAPRSRPIKDEPQEVLSQATLDNSAQRSEGELEPAPTATTTVETEEQRQAAWKKFNRIVSASPWSFMAGGGGRAEYKSTDGKQKLVIRRDGDRWELSDALEGTFTTASAALEVAGNMMRQGQTRQEHHGRKVGDVVQFDHSGPAGWQKLTGTIQEIKVSRGVTSFLIKPPTGRALRVKVNALSYVRPAAPTSEPEPEPMARVHEGGLKMKGPHSPEFTIQRPEGSTSWHLGVAGGHGLPSTSSKFASLPELLASLSEMVDLDDWDDRSRAVIDKLSEPGWERMPESESGKPAPEMHAAISRAEFKRRGFVAISKNADLNKYGYQIVHWIDPKAFKAAREAGPDAKVGPGAEIYEYVPWKDKTLPRYTAITRDEQSAVHEAIAPGVHLEQLAMIPEEKKVRPLHGDVPSPFLMAPPDENKPAEEPAQATMDVRSKEEKRTEVISKLMREGKLATAEIGWAMFALKDVSDQVSRDNAGRWRTPEMEAPILEAAAKLYELEKDAGARPTTSRGVREALSIPAHWEIPERRGIDPAYLVHLPDDRILKLSWSPKRQAFMGYREAVEYGGASGRYTRVIDKKKVLATDLVAAELKRVAAWDAGREDQSRREVEAEKTAAELDPNVQGPRLEIAIDQAQRPAKGGQQFDNGVEWAKKLAAEKMAIPHQGTERMFEDRRSHAPGVRGVGLTLGWTPMPRQYRALKELAGIADSKLYMRARPGQPARIAQPGLTPAKRAFWTGVATYAQAGMDQWTEGEDSPMAQYVDRFRSAVETVKGEQWLPDVIKSILGGDVRLVLKAEQLGLFGGSRRPPGGGWEIIPKGKHGGYRRRHGNRYDYYYPDKAVIQAQPEPGDEEEVKAEPRLVIETPIAEPRKDEVTAAMAEDRTKGERKKDNAKAIQIVETARSQGRGLTDEEAVLVAGYTGKGGISGDLNQFYTRVDVAEAMWGILGAYQDRVEKVLEPSCGSGVFLQTSPKGTKVTGVELDESAAAVAEVLHGHRHKVEAKSFELYTIENTGKGPQFDAVIGNPPYCVRTGDIPRHKPDIKSADQYFIDTSIDHVRDGGTLVLLVHPGIMNAKGPGFREFRERLLARCEVLDSFRLPKDTFKRYHCEIPADIIVLRKRDSRVGEALVAAMGQESIRPTLANLGAWDQGFVDGDYFETRPDRVLGRAVSAEETGWRSTVEGEVAKAPAAIKRLTEAKINAQRKDPAATPVTFEALVELGKEHEIVRESIKRAEGALARAAIPPVVGNVQTMAGQRYLYIGEPPKWTLMESIDDVSQIIEKSGDVAIKKAYDIARDIEELIRARDQGDFYKARAIRQRTVTAVKGWVKENGIPASHRALVVLSKSAPHLLDFIASVNSVGEPSDILAKDAAITLKPSEVNRADLMSVASYVARRNRGYVVMEDVQHNWEGWEGKDVEEVSQILLGSGDYAHTGEAVPIQHMEDYLTGNLYEKLDAELARADAMPEGDERRQVERQINLIRNRLATKIKSIDDVPIQIRVLGWLPIDWLTRWLNSPEGRRDVFGKKPLKPEDPRARMTYADGIYSLETVGADGEVVHHTEDGTDWLKYMNRLTLKRKRAEDVEHHFEKAFNEWIKAGELRQPLEELYNRTFNGDFRREYSGDPLGIEGIREGVVPHDFQNQAVRWAAETGRGILGQDVGLGKSLAADARVLAPAGWREIGSLAVGDQVIGSTGKPAQVMGVYPQGKLPLYRVRFSDGASVEASGDHLWTLYYRAGGDRWQDITVTTDDVRLGRTVAIQQPGGRTSQLDLGRAKLYLPMLQSPVEFDGGDLPIPAYALGQLIANGSLTDATPMLTTNAADWPEVFSRLGVDLGMVQQRPGCVRATCLKMGGRIRELGLNELSGKKRIPRLYLHAQAPDRIALLQGLMDADGSVSKTRNRLTYHTTSPGLAMDVQELVECLGGIASVSECDRTEEGKSTEYRIRIRVPAWLKPFSVERKVRRYNPGSHALPVRTVEAIEHTRDAEAVCIAVDTPDHLFVTEHAILTHNTFIAILLARLRKQQGLARRPMVVVPKSVATNWAEEIETLIPGSRVLVIGEHRVQSRSAKKKATAEATAQGLVGEALDKYVEANSWSAVSDTDVERNTKLAAMKQNEYDLIICTKPAFERIPLRQETTEKFEKEDFWYQRAGRIDNIVAGSKQQETADKRIEKLKAAWASDKLQQKFKHEMSMVYWEDLGVDTLIADEAHAYKNLYCARSRFGSQPKFLGGSGQSKQARKMQHMARVVRDANPTNGVYLMTATPTKNSPLEVFNMLQHIAPEAFHAMGIENSEQFIDRFCKMETRLILVPPGKNKDAKKTEEDEGEDESDFREEFEGAGNLEAATCVTGFTNLRELEGVMDKYMMLQTATDVGLKIPDAKEHTHLVDMTLEQKAVYATLRADAAATDTREDPGGMFRMLDQMKKAAQDLELYNPTDYSEWYRKSPKYRACVDEAYLGATERGGQIIFCDHNASHERLRTMLIEKGLAPEQIGIINAQVAPDSEARQRIGDAFNRGTVKVVIGNTGTMGEGVNLQGKKAPKGTTDIHHLDQPWDPGTMHQRNGRGVRQGNKAEQVDIHTYLATGSFDGFRHSTLKGKERWLDKLRSGADSITAGMEGQDIDEVEMLAMLSDNPDEALAKIKERRDSAESAWYAKASQESVDTFYSYQRKVGRLAKMKPGDTRERLAEDTARIKRQLLRNEILPLEIKAVLESGDAQPVAVNTFMTGEGDARRLAATVFRAGMVVEEPRAYGEPGKLVITKINLDERKVEVRTWGHALDHTVQIDQLANVGYTVSKYTPVDELREALKNNLEISYTPPLEAIAHISPEVLAANKDMIDEHVRAWYAAHGEDREVLVRKPEGKIEVVPAANVAGAEILYPWGKDRAALVEAIVQANAEGEWRTYTNPLLQTARKEYGYNSYRTTPFNQLVADAESTWKERHAA